MFETTARGILLDIEGTTSSISFVYDVMFPYVRENVATFVRDQWSSDAVVAAVSILASDLGHPSRDQWLAGMSTDEQQRQVVAGVIGLMDADVKATGLKQIQGLVWENGFQNGQLVAHLYDEVGNSIRNWNRAGIDVRIYSSGSIHAQRLFFGHTVEGDLLDQLGGHYDTKTGPKQEAGSYEKIAGDFACSPNQILFISDVVAELVAARQAGLQTLLSVRPGNPPITEQHDFAAVTSFNEISVCSAD